MCGCKASCLLRVGSDIDQVLMILTVELLISLTLRRLFLSSLSRSLSCWCSPSHLLTQSLWKLTALSVSHMALSTPVSLVLACLQSVLLACFSSASLPSVGRVSLAWVGLG